MRSRVNAAYWCESRGHWRIDVQKDGVRKSFYSSTPGRKGKIECHAKADEWLENATNNDKRVRHYLQLWLDHQQKTTSYSSWLQYKSYVKCYFLPELGLIKISKLSERNFQNILDELGSRGLSRKTLSNVRSAASSFCKWCRKHQYSQLRCDDLEIPKIAARSSKSILSVSDFQKVMESSETMYRGKVINDWYINAYRVALLTGLRPGELIALQWSNIDFAEKVICVAGAINIHGEYTSGKNENAKRTIAVGEMCLDLLKAQRSQLNAAGLLSAYVFPTVSGDPVRESTLLATWYRYQDHNGIKRTTLYELRHTFVSINKNLPEGMVRDVVGHSKNMDTFGVYGHLFADEKRQAAEQIESNVSRILSYQK